MTVPNSPGRTGVFINDDPDGDTIAGAKTATALFIGVAARGPLNRPVRCLAFSDFIASFSDDSTTSELARQVELFFVNRGETCFVVSVAGGGVDGEPPAPSDYRLAFDVIDDEVDFDLLVLPPAEHVDIKQLWGPASVFCEKRRALLLMDAPAWSAVETARSSVDAFRNGLVAECSALYFPRLRIVEGGHAVNVGPAGAIAGLIARTDAKRLFGRAAGVDGVLVGAAGVECGFSDQEIETLNSVAINTIRALPTGDIVCWGARTMAGSADASASEWKYVPIRRLSFYIEKSISRGLAWTVFEPNDAQLWSRIRRAVSGFMRTLWAQGALEGVRPEDAYFVRCDATTTTQGDRDSGKVNIFVGFAPVRPAEFIELSLTQAAQV
jgi:uncharacterized protein